MLNPDSIKAWRERQGLSTQDLSKILSVSRITVERWEQWDPRDPRKPKATPTGPAEAILTDLINAEDPKAQSERSENAKRISAMAGGLSEEENLTQMAKASTMLGAVGLIGFGLYQLMKKVWEIDSICPKCQQPGPIDSKFCPSCGAEMPIHANAASTDSNQSDLPAGSRLLKASANTAVNIAESVAMLAQKVAEPGSGPRSNN